ncbi:hypothetical protein [Halostella sp. PRR32]|uniref:hypothetical protein n=1 Tax=Halostella sp. PRR32 TaxID=3098147 RepID=UPI002B1CE843|nr:hypothetical protein [Halostella sp. PRR32]
MDTSASSVRIATVAVAVLVAVSVAVLGINAGTAEGTDLQQEALQQEPDQALNETNLSGANTTLRGVMENDSAGWSMAEAGDVNGDGESDLLVGAPRRHDNSTHAGSAYLFYGPVDEGDINLSDADVTFEGQQRADRTGVAVAGGDLNGNGYADVVVGASHSNNSDGERYAGKVYVVSGGESLNGTVALGNDTTTIDGESWGDHAGYALDVVNHSSEESDLVVGAPYNNSTNTTAGAAYLIEGDEIEFGAGATQSLSDLGSKYAGEGLGDRAGWSVADAGDVDGDGRHDVIVGAYSADKGTNDAGAAYVIYGDDDPPAEATLGEANATLTGADTDDFAGYRVDGAGDVDGDGLADVVVGAPYNNETGTDAGAAYVVRGSDLSENVSLDDAALKLYGESENDLAGFAVSGGPCNETVYVGAPGVDSATGSAYAVGGNATGNASLSGAVATYLGEEEGDGAGFSLAGATNLTGDDTEELLVGAPFHDGNANDSGAAYLVTDACPTSEADVTDAPPEEAPDDGQEDEATIPVHDEPSETDDGDADDNETDDTEDDDDTEGNETDNSDDESTDENETDGSDIEDNVTDGNDSADNATDGNDSADNATDGNDTDDNVTDGNATVGNQTDTDTAETEDDGGTDAVERITPADGEVTVQPGTRMLFEVSVDESVDGPIAAEWTIDGETDYRLGPFHSEYRAEGEEFYKQTFTETGTHEVTATVLNGDQESVGTAEWTVTVEEGGTEAPSMSAADGGGEITLEEDEDTGLAIGEGDAIDLTLDVSDPDGDLHRVVWFYGLQDARLGTTSVSGAQDTATMSVERACQCPVIVWVVDESGAVTERPVWNFTITQPSETTSETATTGSQNGDGDSTVTREGDGDTATATQSSDSERNGSVTNDTSTVESDGTDSTATAERTTEGEDPANESEGPTTGDGDSTPVDGDSTDDIDSDETATEDGENGTTDQAAAVAASH